MGRGGIRRTDVCLTQKLPTRKGESKTKRTTERAVPPIASALDVAKAQRIDANRVGQALLAVADGPFKHLQRQEGDTTTSRARPERPTLRAEGQEQLPRRDGSPVRPRALSKTPCQHIALSTSDRGATCMGDQRATRLVKNAISADRDASKTTDIRQRRGPCGGPSPKSSWQSEPMRLRRTRGVRPRRACRSIVWAGACPSPREGGAKYPSRRAPLRRGVIDDDWRHRADAGRNGTHDGEQRRTDACRRTPLTKRFVGELGGIDLRDGVRVGREGSDLGRTSNIERIRRDPRCPSPARSSMGIECMGAARIGKVDARGSCSRAR